MANGDQIQRNIRHAQDRVAQYGYLDQQQVTDRDVMLAGFGYLSDRLEAAEKGVVKFKLEGKKFLAIGTAAGGTLAGVISELLHRLTV